MPRLKSLSAEEKRRIREKRAKQDPLNYYKPGPTQKRCLECSALYRLIQGPNQSGKTNHAVFETGMYARGKHPTRPWFGPVKILVIAPSRNQLANIWAKRLLEACELPGAIGKLPIIPKREVKRIYKAGFAGGDCPGRVVLKNGSEIFFAVSGDAHSFERIAGFQFDAVVRDEATGTADLGAEIYPRLGVAQQAAAAGTRVGAGWILWASSPTLVNDEFFAFRDKCREGGPDHAFFLIGPDENPAFGLEARTRMAGAMSEEDAKIRMYGTGSAEDEVLIYAKQFRPERHVLLEDYEPEPLDNLHLAIDPGAAGPTGHPTGLLLLAIRPDAPTWGEMTQGIVLDYLETERLTPDDNGKVVADWLAGRVLECVTIDPMVTRGDPFGRSFDDIWQKALRDAGVKWHSGWYHGENNHAKTINTVRTYFDPVPDHPEMPPMLKINPRCKRLISQITAYRGSERKNFTGPGGVVKRFDEGVDALRYWCTKRWNYVRRAPQVARRVEETPEPAPPKSEWEAMMQESDRISLQRYKALFPERSDRIGRGTLIIG